jgi:ABC-type multidrug transport system permease subunit
VVVALFYGSIYYQLPAGNDPDDYSNRLGLFFFCLMFMIIGHQQALPAMLDDRLVFYRERGAKAYGAFSYWFSCWIIQIPLILVNVLLFSVILYPMAGLNSHSSEEFGYFYFIMLLSSYCGYYVACFIAAISPSTQAALSYYPIVLFFSVSFAGFLVYIPQFPDWLGDW